MNNYKNILGHIERVNRLFNFNNLALNAIRKHQVVIDRIYPSEISRITSLHNNIPLLTNIQSKFALSPVYAHQNLFKLSSVLEEYKNISELYRGISQSKLQEVYEGVIDLYDIADQNEVQELTESVQEKIKESPKSTLSLEFYLSLVIAVIIFIYSQESSQDSEERIMVRFNEIETMLNSQLNQVKRDEGSVYYIVKRMTFLQRSIDDKEVISILYPNIKTRLVERNKKWIKVEYFDYISNTHKSGWVRKKYLTLLRNK